MSETATSSVRRQVGERNGKRVREPVALLWSGGKDSALALHALQRSQDHQVRSLLTTVTEGYERVSIHGVRLALLEAQAASLGLPLYTHRIPPDCSNIDYEASMTEALGELFESGIRTVAAGDIFLADVRHYREGLFTRAGMKGLFPLWQQDTEALARNFVELGFKARVACIDTQVLAGCFTGRTFDQTFLAKLPAAVDPCGENGEFHTFVYDGPLFESPIPITVGEVVMRGDRFCYCDLLAPSFRAGSDVGN